jgi:hypothetical protein
LVGQFFALFDFRKHSGEKSFYKAVLKQSHQICDSNPYTFLFPLSRISTNVLVQNCQQLFNGIMEVVEAVKSMP